MLRTPLLSSILSFIFLALPVYAETVVSDIDGDGIEDIRDNCPSEYNPEQESLFYDVVFLGDACNPDDDVDGVSDEIEDQREYRDARGEDLEKDANGEVIHTVNNDTDGDGANDIYELNTGTDPFVANNFGTLSLTDYMPLGDIEYTYRARVAIGPPKYNEEFTESISEDSPGVYKNTSYALFGEGDHYYRVGKDGIYLKNFSSSYFLDGVWSSDVSEVDLLHLPFEIQEGGTLTNSRAVKCTGDSCEISHTIYMIDKGEMDFNGEIREYVTLASPVFHRSVYYIYLKGIGLYGTHYMNLTDYKINSRVDVEAVAAALPDEEQTGTTEPEASSSSGGGALNLFWLVLASLSLLARRRICA